MVVDLVLDKIDSVVRKFVVVCYSLIYWAFVRDKYNKDSFNFVLGSERQVTHNLPKEYFFDLRIFDLNSPTNYDMPVVICCHYLSGLIKSCLL